MFCDHFTVISPTFDVWTMIECRKYTDNMAKSFSKAVVVMLKVENVHFVRICVLIHETHFQMIFVISVLDFETSYRFPVIMPWANTSLYYLFATVIIRGLNFAKACLLYFSKTTITQHFNPKGLKWRKKVPNRASVLLEKFLVTHSHCFL